MRVRGEVDWLDGPMVRQFLKYGLVGASNTILTFVVYSVLVTLDVDYLLAIVLGYSIGSLNSYVLNPHWTLPARDRARLQHRLAEQLRAEPSLDLPCRRHRPRDGRHSLRRRPGVRDRRQRGDALRIRAPPWHRENSRAGDPHGAGAGRHVLCQSLVVVRASRGTWRTAADCVVSVPARASPTLS